LVAEAFDQHETAMKEYEVSSMLRGQGKKIAEQRVRKALEKNDDASARNAAAALLDEESNEPTVKRYETNDATIEKLGELLSQNPNGLLLFRDELSAWLRYLDKEENAGARAAILETWSGTGELTYDRIGRGTVRIPSNTVSILGGIQPGPLSQYVRDTVAGGIGADGLLQRFQLFVWPDVTKEWRDVDRWPDTPAKNTAFEVFRYLDALSPEDVGAEASDDFPFLRFTGEAQDRFSSWRGDLERRLRGDTEHPAFEAHLAKYRKLLPALALTVHLSERGTGCVTAGALDKALRWLVYLEAHARRVYSPALRADAASARELAKHIQRGNLGARFNLREVYRRGWTALSTKEDALAAVETLSDLGWIRAIPDLATGAGRPQSPSYETNPENFKTPESRSRQN